MRRLLPLILPIVAGALLASAASAQSCVGLPSFDGKPLHVNVAAEFPDSAKAYGLGLGLGRPNGIYGNAGLLLNTFEWTEENATIGFVDVGFQIPVGPLQLCPIAGVSYAVGPNDEALWDDITSWQVAGGAALGLPLRTGFASVIPNVAVRYVHDETTVEVIEIGSATETFDGTVLDLGVALVLGDRISVQPIAHIPMSGEEEEVSFGVFAALAIGLPR
jgi:hypothetical protein